MIEHRWFIPYCLFGSHIRPDPLLRLCSVCTNKVLAVNCFVDCVEFYWTKNSFRARDILSNPSKGNFIISHKLFLRLHFLPLSTVPCHSLLPFLLPASPSKPELMLKHWNLCNLLILKSETGNKMVNVLWIRSVTSLIGDWKVFMWDFLPVLYSFSLLCITTALRKWRILNILSPHMCCLWIRAMSAITYRATGIARSSSFSSWTSWSLENM